MFAAGGRENGNASFLTASRDCGWLRRSTRAKQLKAELCKLKNAPTRYEFYMGSLANLFMETCTSQEWSRFRRSTAGPRGITYS